MKVIKCDRCGKIYDPIRTSADECNQLSFGYEIKIDGVDKHKTLFYLDLCPECADTVYKGIINYSQIIKENKDNHIDSEHPITISKSRDYVIFEKDDEVIGMLSRLASNFLPVIDMLKADIFLNYINRGSDYGED